jgi:hypothetical protein
MAKRDLKESDTAKLDLQKPDTAKLDLKEPDVVQLTIQEPETREITLRPERAGRAAALMDHAAAGGAAPHPRATDPRAAELAPALAATSWPGNPATFDPEVTRHLYTQAPDWFPAMASAKEGHVEARADRLVRRDYAVALQNADRRNDRSAWDRLAGFAEGNKGLTEVLARSRAQAQQRAEGKRRDQGAER